MFFLVTRTKYVHGESPYKRLIGHTVVYSSLGPMGQDYFDIKYCTFKKSCPSCYLYVEGYLQVLPGKLLQADCDDLDSLSLH